MEERLTRQVPVSHGPRGLCQATIDDLSDDVLLEIFDFYLDDKDPNEPSSVDKWHLLVHVCRWWRSVVFSSPRRLDLRLLCTRNRSVGAMLDIWPVLPIQIDYHLDWTRDRALVTWQNNMIAALEHPDRASYISIVGFPMAWDALAGAMQVPFPELTYLQLWLGSPISVFPGGCGPTPRLRTLRLKGLPYPAMRDRLLSAGDLVDLSLCDFNFLGYSLSESVVPCLSSLQRLESLQIKILGCPDRPSPPPQACAVLPALAKLSFKGMNKYLEDFIARIDAPMLSQLNVSTSPVRGHVFDIPRLRRFIGRAKGLEPFRAATVLFESLESWSILLEFPPNGSTLQIERMDLPYLPSMALVCNQLSPLTSHVERLELLRRYSRDAPRGANFFPDSALFAALFRSFTAIQGLYVTKTLMPLIGRILQELIRDGERAIGVLPNLCDLFSGGSEIPEYVEEAIQPFVDARGLSGRPIAIHHWKEGRAWN